MQFKVTRTEWPTGGNVVAEMETKHGGARAIGIFVGVEPADIAGMLVDLRIGHWPMALIAVAEFSDLNWTKALAFARAS